MGEYTLPKYLKPLPHWMTSSDIEYLFIKGALSICELSTRNALLRSYLEYFHPYMPLVPIYDILQIVQDETGRSGRISLILFQAIMFAGSAFVDIEYLLAAGYSSRMNAQRELFQKVRVCFESIYRAFANIRKTLYNCDYENDRISLVQSLLLMTYWSEVKNEEKDAWYWMGVAISLLHTIGSFHPEKSDANPRRKRLWKRIWWSCFMRDRLLALGGRRQAQLRGDYHDIPLLDKEDFDIISLPECISIIPGDCILARNIEAQMELAQICIAKAKLCLCMDRALPTKSAALGDTSKLRELESVSESTSIPSPKAVESTEYDDLLNQWIAGLPLSCVYSSEMRTGESDAPILFHKSLLHIIYQTTVSALHEQRLSPSAASTLPVLTAKLRESFVQKTVEASRDIMNISQNLRSCGLESHLLTSDVTFLPPRVVYFLLDVYFGRHEARQKAKIGFWQCIQVLEKLECIHATRFGEAVISENEIDVPLEEQESYEDNGVSHSEERHIDLPSLCLLYSPTNYENSYGEFDDNISTSSSNSTYYRINGSELSVDSDRLDDYTDEMNEFLHFDDSIEIQDLFQGAHTIK
jgi:hypothetical protein